MFGSIQVQKFGQDANTNFGLAQAGPFGGAGFIADPESQNLSGGSDPLELVIPNSGMGVDALKNFSIIASGTIGSAAGSWIFNIALDLPTSENVPLGPHNRYAGAPVPQWFANAPYAGSPQTPPQRLPQIVASAEVTVSSQTSFSFEADVTNTSGILSGSWIFSLNNEQAASGSLSNLPGNFSRVIAAFLQIGAMPDGSSVSDVVVAVSVAGYNGSVVTLN